MNKEFQEIYINLEPRENRYTLEIGAYESGSLIHIGENELNENFFYEHILFYLQRDYIWKHKKRQYEQLSLF